MPATQRGSAYKIATGKWGLRYYDADGERRRKSPFPSKSAALAHYRDVVEPGRRGDPAAMPVLTLGQFVPLYLERHAASVRPRTVDTLRERLAHAVAAFGDVPLRDLERMGGDVASWQARLPERSRYGVVQALRHTLGAAVRWGHMKANPALLAGVNRQPAPRTIRTYSRKMRSTPSPPSWRQPTRRSRRSPLRPGCGPRSGRRSNAVTLTVAGRR